MKGLKELHRAIDSQQPSTINGLKTIIEYTHRLDDREWDIMPVYYYGYYQGVQIHVYGRKLTHILPKKGHVYAIAENPDERQKGSVDKKCIIGANGFEIVG